MQYIVGASKARELSKSVKRPLLEVIRKFDKQIEQLAYKGLDRMIIDLLPLELNIEQEHEIINTFIKCGYSIKEIDGIDKCYIVSWSEKEE